jgi:hypothetical protein
MGQSPKLSLRGWVAVEKRSPQKRHSINCPVRVSEIEKIKQIRAKLESLVGKEFYV